MNTKQSGQSNWPTENEVNLDQVSGFSAMDIFGSIVIMGLAFGILVPFLI